MKTKYVPIILLYTGSLTLHMLHLKHQYLITITQGHHLPFWDTAVILLNTVDQPGMENKVFKLILLKRPIEKIDLIR